MTQTILTRYLHRAPFTIDALSLDVPVLIEDHPNKAPFSGILTRVDEPSTRPPNGANSHRVLIPRTVAEQALPSLVGMPIDCSLNLKDHDKKNVIGFLDGGLIEGKDLVVTGYLLEKNYPDEVAEIRSKKSQLGMSYEIADVSVEDTEASIWVLSGLVFTGAAILRKDAAAYANTAIAAQAEEELFMPGEGATIMEELKKIGLKLDAALDEDASDEEDAAARDEEAAAVRSEANARKARDEADEEDAARHEAEASRLRLNAATRHDAAAAKRLAAAQQLAAEETEAKAREEMAAARHTEAAKRLRDEDAACKAQREEEAAAKKGDEDDDADTMPALVAMLLTGLGYSRTADAAAGTVKAKEDDSAMATMMGRMMLKAMGGRTAPAVHDDEAEDTALFKRLLRMNEHGDVKASAQRRSGTTDDLDRLRLRRQLRDLQAGMELITDTLTKQSGLITDLVHKTKNLATDESRSGQGGPVRRTLAATGLEHFVGPFDEGTSRGEGKMLRMIDIDAALDKAGLEVGAKNNLTRMAKKLEALHAGLVAPE